MPYTMEDFLIDYVTSHLKTISPEKRLEALRSLPSKELLKAVPLDEIEAYLEECRQSPSPPPEKPKKRRRKSQMDDRSYRRRIMRVRA